MHELIPPVLFKYFPPERLDVLTRGRIRVSQRQAVNDPQDFRPPFVDAAPDDILARVLEAQVANDPEIPVAARPGFVHHMVSRYRDDMLQGVLANIKTPDLIGMVCLTERPDIEEMWQKYAAGATGFVVPAAYFCHISSISGLSVRQTIPMRSGVKMFANTPCSISSRYLETMWCTKPGRAATGISGSFAT